MSGSHIYFVSDFLCFVGTHTIHMIYNGDLKVVSIVFQLSRNQSSGPLRYSILCNSPSIVRSAILADMTIGGLLILQRRKVDNSQNRSSLWSSLKNMMTSCNPKYACCKIRQRTCALNPTMQIVLFKDSIRFLINLSNRNKCSSYAD